MSFSGEKELVRTFLAALDGAEPSATEDVIYKFTSDTHSSYLSFPWRKLDTSKQLASQFWTPLKTSFSALQRREDIFFAGVDAKDGKTWVVSMGHYLGLFDRAWLDIPPTRRSALIRYAEFHEVQSGKISQTGIFIDLIGLMRQAGIDPLPQETGHHFVYPGPRSHDGILLGDQDPTESQKTAELVDRMVEDLNTLNLSGEDRCPPEVLARTWHEDMIWYGPAGIGATHTIERYQEQHQYPFREGLKNKEFNGHIARIAEGRYAGFFGWPNLRNTPDGFLGVSAPNAHAEMQVVDIYRREGEKLAENWVIIDLPYWLSQVGIDVFEAIPSKGQAHE